MKKSLIFILIFSLLLGICGISFSVYISNTTYNQTQYEENYKTGYDDALGESVALKNQLKIYSNEIKDLNTEINALEVLKNDYKEKYESGEITISELNNQISTFELEISTLTSTIEEKQNDINTLELRLKEVGAYYFHTVKYLDIDGSLVDYDIVEPGQTSSTDISPVYGSHINHIWCDSYDNYPMVFLGWSLDRNNIIDLSSTHIDKDTTFFAVYERTTYYEFNEQIFENSDTCSSNFYKFSIEGMGTNNDTYSYGNPYIEYEFSATDSKGYTFTKTIQVRASEVDDNWYYSFSFLGLDFQFSAWDVNIYITNNQKYGVHFSVDDTNTLFESYSLKLVGLYRTRCDTFKMVN